MCRVLVLQHAVARGATGACLVLSFALMAVKRVLSHAGAIDYFLSDQSVVLGVTSFWLLSQASPKRNQHGYKSSF